MKNDWFSRATVGVVLSGSIVSPSTVRADSAVAWGSNSYQQLGSGITGSLPRSLTPLAVASLSSGVTAVAAGGSSSFAIQNGTALAWGNNLQGQLGSGLGQFTIPTAVPVSGLSSGVTAITSGSNHGMAIQHGAAKSWGVNTYGQLGNGTSGSSAGSNVPLEVSGLANGVTAIAGGLSSSMAIQNGAVLSWGRNNFGQLGNGTTANSDVPLPVNDLSSGVTAIAMGYNQSLAIKNGAAVAWGSNSFGQLGNGTSGAGVISTTPVSVSGLSSGVTAIAAGAYFCFAIKDGDVYSWGNGLGGSLGNGTTSDISTPVKVLDFNVDLIDVTAGYFAGYALSADGNLWVWGRNIYGQLGLGNQTDWLTPTQLAAPAGFKFTSIAADADSYHAIATIAPVPEPSCLTLLSLTGMAMRRRKGNANSI